MVSFRRKPRNKQKRGRRTWRKDGKSDNRTWRHPRRAAIQGPRTALEGARRRGFRSPGRLPDKAPGASRPSGNRVHEPPGKLDAGRRCRLDNLLDRPRTDTHRSAGPPRIFHGPKHHGFRPRVLADTDNRQASGRRYHPEQDPPDGTHDHCHIEHWRRGKDGFLTQIMRAGKRKRTTPPPYRRQHETVIATFLLRPWAAYAGAHHSRLASRHGDTIRRQFGTNVQHRLRCFVRPTGRCDGVVGPLPRIHRGSTQALGLRRPGSRPYQRR